MKKNDMLEKHFSMIDTIFWNLLESEYYGNIPETTGTVETVKEDEESLMNIVKKTGVGGEALKQIEFQLSAVSTGASLYGEEKGFILGFIHGFKMVSEMQKEYDLFHLGEDLSA